MCEQCVVIPNRLGLHARAAAQLVRTANLYASEVRIERADGSATADAKSILSVLMLAAGRGTMLRVKAHGNDAAQAISHICELIANGFGEE
ncbi:MAG: HPr family phosphocarrier protein [Pyrinomonadaceae bacterium]|nr:HPr family phosphocarrier protein [Pyrinomonadaceae bacterium]